MSISSAGLPLSYIDALEAMSRRGGHFASSLAIAWIHADEGNRRRLERAFPDLLAAYGHTLPPVEESSALVKLKEAKGAVADFVTMYHAEIDRALRVVGTRSLEDYNDIAKELDGLMKAWTQAGEAAIAQVNAMPSSEG